MARRTNMVSYHTTALRQMASPRFFFLLSCVSFIVPIIWMQSMNRSDTTVKEALENVARDIRYVDVYRKAEKQPRSLKYMLLWTPPDYSPFYFFGTGQRAFLENNCPVINCYVTSNRDFFGGDATQFDAIAFNGRNMKYMRRSQLPKKRSPNQKYIYFNLESADNYPVCQNMFDGFFNWTSTYKLNSDVPYPYIVVKNKDGVIVGPKENMIWRDIKENMHEELSQKLLSKKKAAAWFVSHCSDRSGRRNYERNLERALVSYGYTVDVFGACGSFKCPINNKSECDRMLEKDYYFYLAFENSFGEDYVTEKLLTALQHYTVPIVYGSANYSRFLPPGSYLDARKMSPEHLAAEMARLIASPKLYFQYFRWRNYYEYFDATAVDNVCAVCAALNNETFVEMKSCYQEFRNWWNPRYSDRCSWIDDIAGMDGLWP